MKGSTLFVDKAKIAMAVNSRIPLSVTSYTVPRVIEQYMNDVLLEFLKALHLEYMAHYLIYCENELVTNAKKANTKRVYFAEKKLDINNQDDYTKGMETFKNDTLNNIGHYMQLQKASKLYIKLVLLAKDNRIVMEVRNNASMTRLEQHRIFDRVRKAQQYTSVEDAVLHVLDDSEGAGIGLVIMMLMLKKFGMTEDDFRVSCKNNETVVGVSIPISRAIQREEEIVAEEFEEIIQNLPQFPENISRLHQLCDDPDADLFAISRYISGDVAISGELLRRVNSAAAGLAEPCSSIRDAVKLVGTHGIKNMLYSLASIQTFRAVSGTNERLWQHAHKVAFFSYTLARAFCPGSAAASEDAFTGGLLH
ncbi:MAG: HDOD domain-containing protein, partial [Treponemataceae bacterium]|nr:HDOD domain-containing protein [Treponemataceae bacterium]